MSPEEYVSKMPSKESDIYAFGIILWELLTGKKPSKRTREDKSWFEKPERDEIPAEYCETPQGQIFAELIRACWRKDHQARPSAKKLQQELIASGSYFHPKAEWVCLAQELAEQFHHGQQELSLNYQPSNLVNADLEQRVWVDDFLTQEANLFLTGKSGSGKSFTLNRWGQSQLKKCWSWIDNTGIDAPQPLWPLSLSYHTLTPWSFEALEQAFPKLVKKFSPTRSYYLLVTSDIKFQPEPQEACRLFVRTPEMLTYYDQGTKVALTPDALDRHTVTELDLSQEKNISKLIEIIQAIPTLTSLNLSQTFNGKSHSEIIHICKNLPLGLLALDLTANYLRDRTCAEIITILCALPPGLKHLCLGKNALGKLTTRDLIQVFSFLPQGLISLDLAWNELAQDRTLEELIIIVNALPKTLLSLSLGSNGIFSRTIEELLCLFHCLPPRLISLDLSGTRHDKSQEKLIQLLIRLPINIKFFHDPNSHTIDLDNLKAKYLVDQVSHLTMTGHSRQLNFDAVSLPFEIDEEHLNLLITKMEKQHTSIAFLTCGLLLQGHIPNVVAEKDNLEHYTEIRLHHAIDFYTKISAFSSIQPLAEFLLWEIKTIPSYPSIQTRLAQYDLAPPDDFLQTYSAFRKRDNVTMPLLKELGMFQREDNIQNNRGKDENSMVLQC